MDFFDLHELNQCMRKWIDTVRCNECSQSVFLTCIDTCFKFIIKDLISPKNTVGGDYVWHEMTFCCTWVDQKELVILCFDFPEHLQESLISTVSRTLNPTVSTDSAQLMTYSFGSLHCTIVEQVVSLYDDSVWSIRDSLRHLEKVRSSVSLNYWTSIVDLELETSASNYGRPWLRSPPWSCPSCYTCLRKLGSRKWRNLSYRSKLKAFKSSSCNFRRPARTVLRGCYWDSCILQSTSECFERTIRVKQSEISERDQLSMFMRDKGMPTLRTLLISLGIQRCRR